MPRQMHEAKANDGVAKDGLVLPNKRTTTVCGLCNRLQLHRAFTLRPGCVETCGTSEACGKRGGTDVATIAFTSVRVVRHSASPAGERHLVLCAALR